MKTYKQITPEERFEIHRLLSAGMKPSKIADIIGKDKSSISREIKRNKTATNGYLPDTANKLAGRRKRKNSFKLDKYPHLKSLVLKLLYEDKWSPNAIAGRLLNEEHTVRICAETIYQYIYLSDFGIKFQLFQLLPKQKPRRQKRRYRKKRSKILGRVSIHKRPEINELGHFEADLICFGKSGKNLSSAADIQSKLLLLKLNPSKHSETVINNLKNTMKNNNIKPKSFTFDNGMEFAKHNLLVKNGCKTYFCDPYCSYQKPRVEHSSGLTRRFFPKNFDQSMLDDNLVEKVQNIINLTPRKSLNFKTPYEAHFGLSLTLTCCTSF